MQQQIYGTRTQRLERLKGFGQARRRHTDQGLIQAPAARQARHGVRYDNRLAGMDDYPATSPSERTGGFLEQGQGAVRHDEYRARLEQ
jgi:hypothetical protein